MVMIHTSTRLFNPIRHGEMFVNGSKMAAVAMASLSMSCSVLSIYSHEGGLIEHANELCKEGHVMRNHFKLYARRFSAIVKDFLSKIIGC